MDSLPDVIEEIINSSEIEKSHLINISPFVKYLWILRKSFSFSGEDCVQRYLCIIDIFGVEHREVRQFILFMSPSTKKNCFLRIFFVPTSCEAEIEDDGREYAVFARMLEKIEIRRMKSEEEKKKEDLNEELLKNERIHCFSKECLRLLMIVIYDYFIFRDIIVDKKNSNHIGLREFMTTLRSFSFECIGNTILPAPYERSRKKKIDQIIEHCM